MKANRGRLGGRDADDRGISVIIGAILLASLLLATLLTIRLTFVPVWAKDAEAARLNTVGKQLGTLKADLDRQVDNRTSGSVANPITLGEESASALRPRGPAHGMSFGSTGAALTVSSNRFLILTNNGTTTAGLNPTWQTISSGPVVSDVVAVQSLRLRVDDVDSSLDEKFVNLTVTSGGVYKGKLSFTVDNVNGADYNVIIRTLDENNQELAASLSAYANNQHFSFYYVDCLDAAFLFDQIIAAADKPLDIALTQSPGVTASYAITYLQASGGGTVIVGNTGTLRAPYFASYAGGTMQYSAPGQYFPSQTFIIENGALIVQQADGAAFKVPPSFSASLANSVVGLVIGVPSLTGQPSSLTGGTTASVLTRPISQTFLQAQAPRYSMTLQTQFPALWANFWDRSMAAAGLTSTGLQPQYTVTQTSNSATLNVFGVTSDPASIAYDMTVTFKQGNIDVTLTG